MWAEWQGQKCRVQLVAQQEREYLVSYLLGEDENPGVHDGSREQRADGDRVR
jgi:hypothetical protein